MPPSAPLCPVVAWVPHRRCLSSSAETPAQTAIPIPGAAVLEAAQSDHHAAADAGLASECACHIRDSCAPTPGAASNGHAVSPEAGSLQHPASEPTSESPEPPSLPTAAFIPARIALGVSTYIGTRSTMEDYAFAMPMVVPEDAIRPSQPLTPPGHHAHSSSTTLSGSTWPPPSTTPFSTQPSSRASSGDLATQLHGPPSSVWFTRAACFGVFDGHGGHEVAETLVQHTPAGLQREVSRIAAEGPRLIGEVLVGQEQLLRSRSNQALHAAASTTSSASGWSPPHPPSARESLSHHSLPHSHTRSHSSQQLQQLLQYQEVLAGVPLAPRTSPRAGAQGSDHHILLQAADSGSLAGRADLRRSPRPGSLDVEPAALRLGVQDGSARRGTHGLRVSSSSGALSPTHHVRAAGEVPSGFSIQELGPSPGVRLVPFNQRLSAFAVHGAELHRELLLDPGTAGQPAAHRGEQATHSPLPPRAPASPGQKAWDRHSHTPASSPALTPVASAVAAPRHAGAAAPGSTHGAAPPAGMPPGCSHTPASAPLAAQQQHLAAQRSTDGPVEGVDRGAARHPRLPDGPPAACQLPGSFLTAAPLRLPAAAPVVTAVHTRPAARLPVIHSAGSSPLHGNGLHDYHAWAAGLLAAAPADHQLAATGAALRPLPLLPQTREPVPAEAQEPEAAGSSTLRGGLHDHVVTPGMNGGHTHVGGVQRRTSPPGYSNGESLGGPYEGRMPGTTPPAGGSTDGPLGCALPSSLPPSTSCRPLAAPAPADPWQPISGSESHSVATAGGQSCGNQAAEAALPRPVARSVPQAGQAGAAAAGGFDADMWERDPGSTALVATIIDGWMHVANVGDCRLVMAELNHETGRIEARRITCDHTATTHPGEAARLAALQVPVSEDGYVGENGGMLQVSRSIGDFSTKQMLGESVILSEPELHSVALTAQTLFAIACSDGVTCAISDESMVNMVCKFLNDRSPEGSINCPQHASHQLVRYVVDAAASPDNASAVVVVFSDEPPPLPKRPRLFAKRP